MLASQPPLLPAPTPSTTRGALQVDGTLHIETEDAVGINHASNTVTAQSLYIATKTRGNGTLASATSADAYRMTDGTGNFTGGSTIISRGRGVVFTGAQGSLNLGFASSGLTPETGVAKLGLGPLASIQADQTAIQFGNAALNSYTLIGAGASVGGAAGLYRDGTGNSHLEISAGAILSGDIVLDDGSDQVTLNGQVDLTNIPVIDGGDDMSSADGMIDNLNFRGGYSGILNDKFVNWENVNFYDGTYTVAGGVLSAGYDANTGVFIHSGSILDAGNAITVDANLTTADTGTFSIRGGGSGTYLISGMLTNGGIVASDDGATGDTLAVLGDFVGDGGTYQIDTVLYDDASLTDLMVVQGNTSGASFVKVVNAGGSGTMTTEGIRIIDVAGESEGAFVLSGDYVHEEAPAVVGGAYAYKLYKGGIATPADGDWYLRSTMTTTDPEDPDPNDPDPGNPDPDNPDPGNPEPPTEPLYQAGDSVYETYPQVLLGLSGLPTLQQRVGNRYWAKNGNRPVSEGADLPALPDAPDEDYGPFVQKAGAWMRIEGAHTSIEPTVSGTQAIYDYNTFRLQAGYDAPLLEHSAGTLVGGVNIHYARAAASVSSPYDADTGRGKIGTNGIGIGGTLTWYGSGGLYFDSQAQATWYDSDLSIAGGRLPVASGNDGFGYAFSIEAGQRIALSPVWSITPQAQLTYARVDFDDFNDVFGASVSLEHGGKSLLGRLGISLDYENTWQNDKGLLNRAHVYAIANLYKEFEGSTRVNVSGVNFASDRGDLWGGIGVGGSYNWDDDKFSMYGEALVTTGLDNFGDSYSVKGTVGVHVKW